MNKAILCVLVVVGLAANATPNPATPSRFQADKFLDMLARTFDSKTAYLDLLRALHRRLNLDPIGNTTEGVPVDGVSGTGASAINTGVVCPEAGYSHGSTITYTPSSRGVGSRAFYECNKGFTGRSVFIQCLTTGQWSPVVGWDGCRPVNCGTAPQVTNADASISPTTYGSTVYYTCRSGYKMNVASGNSTCQETGQWTIPNFRCDRIATPPPPQANNNNNGFNNMAAMAALMNTMAGGEGRPPAGQANPMMTAMMNGMSGMGGFPMMGGQQQPGANNNIMDMMKMMAGGFQQTAAPTTTPPPPQQQHNSFQTSLGGNNGGIQLPSHLKNLLPNGLANAQGFKPQDLIALTNAGLGSAAGGAGGPPDINSMLSSMNPMAMLSSGGLGGLGALGGLGGLGGGMGPGGRGRQPIDPELMAEQREEMMMRAMMANAMKSMMGGQQQQGNGTANANNGMNMLTMMALQNGLGGSGGSGGGGLDAILPMMMGGSMGGLMGGMGGGGAGLLSGLFGGA